MMAESQFRQDFHSRLDSHSAAWFIYIAASKWLAYLLDTISLLYIAFVTFYFVFFEQGLKILLKIKGLTTNIYVSIFIRWSLRWSIHLVGYKSYGVRNMEYFLSHFLNLYA